MTLLISFFLTTLPRYRPAIIPCHFRGQKLLGNFQAKRGYCMIVGSADRCKISLVHPDLMISTTLKNIC